jgi:hypothetical protein
MFIKWFGMDVLDSVLNRGQTTVTAATTMALNEEAQLMFAASQRRVPVKHGTLRRSGIILPPIVQGTSVIIQMGYGGAASAYALVQHERQDFRHKDGQTWKYLETPVRERIPNLEIRLQNRIGRILST